MSNMEISKKLTKEQTEKILSILKARFEKNTIAIPKQNIQDAGII
ncbi:MAG: hypothetical protein WCK31_03830 [bacterium]